MGNEKSKKKFGFIITCLVLLISVFTFNAKVEAKNTYADEIEPNDTRAQAQLILENNSTPEGHYNSSIGNTYQMNGKSSTTDEDWFKVILTKGKKYFTCNEQAFYYHIEDEAGNLIKEGAFNKEARVFTFETPSEGLYYVRIKGVTSEQTKYAFHVGSPIYSAKSVNIPCKQGTISMTGGTKKANFDSSNLNIPVDAVVTSLNFNKIRTTDVSSISLINNETGVKLSMNQYSWSLDDLESSRLPAASMWTASFGYQKSTSFNPSITMYYLYPVYS